MYLRIVRPNIGKSRQIYVTNVRMKNPYAKGTRVQRLSRFYGTISAIKNGYGLIRRKNNNNRGRDNEIFFHFSGVFHPKK